MIVVDNTRRKVRSAKGQLKPTIPRNADLQMAAARSRSSWTCGTKYRSCWSAYYALTVLSLMNINILVDCVVVQTSVAIRLLQDRPLQPTHECHDLVISGRRVTPGKALKQHTEIADGRPTKRRASSTTPGIPSERNKQLLYRSILRSILPLQCSHTFQQVPKVFSIPLFLPRHFVFLFCGMSASVASGVSRGERFFSIFCFFIFFLRSAFSFFLFLGYFKSL